MHPGSHRHEAEDPRDLLARAETVCAEKRLKFTPWRRRVFEELAASVSPAGAYDLVERLGRERRVSPISIYRALDFLIAAGLIHRIAARNTYLPCHHDHPPGETTVFLVCTRCGGVDEVSSCELGQSLEGTAAEVGFQTRSRAVELEGECSACRQGA